MKYPWFKQGRWFSQPLSWQGWTIDIFALLFILTVFLAVDRNSHSVSDTFYGIFPYVVPAYLLVEWIASKTSKKK